MIPLKKSAWTGCAAMRNFMNSLPDKKVAECFVFVKLHEIIVLSNDLIITIVFQPSQRYSLRLSYGVVFFSSKGCNKIIKLFVKCMRWLK